MRRSTVRRYSSADPVPPIDPNTLAVNAIWQRVAGSAVSGGRHASIRMGPASDTAAGGGRGGRGGGGGGGGRGGQPPVDAGAYSVKLTVNGKTFTQPLTVKPDPRDKK